MSDDDLCFVPATELARRITEMHAVRCTFDCIDPVPVEDNFVATQLYRIAQEAITNSLKHGKAASICVSLETRAGYVTLRVADDGVGLTAVNGQNEGMGLRIMKYRAGQIGAQFVVRPPAPFTRWLLARSAVASAVCEQRGERVDRSNRGSPS